MVNKWFDDKELPIITNKDELEQAMGAVKARFNGHPHKFTRNDYLLFINTLYAALLNISNNASGLTSAVLSNDLITNYSPEVGYVGPGKDYKKGDSLEKIITDILVGQRDKEELPKPSINGENFLNSASIEIIAAEEYADKSLIYYTTSDYPGWRIYDGAFTITKDTTIKAKLVPKYDYYRFYEESGIETKDVKKIQKLRAPNIKEISVFLKSHKVTITHSNTSGILMCKTDADTDFKEYEPFTITESTRVYAYVKADNDTYTDSDIVDVFFKRELGGPKIEYDSKSFYDYATITIVPLDHKGITYYKITVDGTPEKYTTPFKVYDTAEIYAWLLAEDENYQTSNMSYVKVTKLEAIQLQDPIFLTDLVFSNSVYVQIHNPNPVGKIQYSIDDQTWSDYIEEGIYIDKPTKIYAKIISDSLEYIDSKKIDLQYKRKLNKPEVTGGGWYLVYTTVNATAQDTEGELLYARPESPWKAGNSVVVVDVSTIVSFKLASLNNELYADSDVVDMECRPQLIPKIERTWKYYTENGEIAYNKNKEYVEGGINLSFYKLISINALALEDLSDADLAARRYKVLYYVNNNLYDADNPPVFTENGSVSMHYILTLDGHSITSYKFLTNITRLYITLNIPTISGNTIFDNSTEVTISKNQGQHNDKVDLWINGTLVEGESATITVDSTLTISAKVTVKEDWEDYYNNFESTDTKTFTKNEPIVIYSDMLDPVGLNYTYELPSDDPFEEEAEIIEVVINSIGDKFDVSTVPQNYEDKSYNKNNSYYFVKTQNNESPIILTSQELSSQNVSLFEKDSNSQNWEGSTLNTANIWNSYEYIGTEEIDGKNYYKYQYNLISTGAVLYQLTIN